MTKPESGRGSLNDLIDETARGLSARSVPASLRGEVRARIAAAALPRQQAWIVRGAVAAGCLGALAVGIALLTRDQMSVRVAPVAEAPQTVAADGAPVSPPASADTPVPQAPQRRARPAPPRTARLVEPAVSVQARTAAPLVIGDITIEPIREPANVPAGPDVLMALHIEPLSLSPLPFP